MSADSLKSLFCSQYLPKLTSVSSIWSWHLPWESLMRQEMEEEPGGSNAKQTIEDKNGDDDRNRDATKILATSHLTTSPSSYLYPAPTLACEQWAGNLPDSKHVRSFISTNWAETPLGPLSSWSISLRLHIFTLFADTKASILFWGTEKVKIYNEHFLDLTQRNDSENKSSLYTPVEFPELWSLVEAEFAQAEESGVATRLQEMEMYVHRSGFKEEAYFSGNIIPMRGNSGKVEGFYVQAREVTNSTIIERRRNMLNNMKTAPWNGVTSSVIPTFKENPRDIPLAMLYIAEEEQSGEVILNLQGSIGIPEGHPMAVNSFNLNSNTAFAPLFRKAKSKIIMLEPDERFDGVEWQGFGEPSKIINVIPILTPDRLFGFLLIGANPRRPIDINHHQFIRDISSKLSAIGVSVLTSEQTRKREERLQRELAESTKRIRYMAEHASIGMQYLSVDGTTIWANDEYYRLTSHPREKELQYPLSFLDTYVPSDRVRARQVWDRLIQGEYKISSEFHLNHEYMPPSGKPEPSCVQTQSFRVTEGENLSSIITFTTDISTFKWAQASEARKAAEASEAKRKKEEFIDLLSHELRNPLSAIFQLADTVINSFPEGESVFRSDLEEALRSNIENANTIIMCAKHQKRIVDDVLTLSKLKYTMLSISPHPAQLPVFTKQTIKMFQQELNSHGIHISTVSDPSLEIHKVDWVMCDESRVQQILINLLTNAIKFTKRECERDIEVRIGACLFNPRSHFPDMYWAPKQELDEDDHPLNIEWGSGEPLYLTFMVHDSGVGMSLDEIQKLFTRFEQANERTSIRYGGSGLGLFVSKKLAEKQGGEIGVRSIPGVGSTFGFYLKSRRAENFINLPIINKVTLSQTTPPNPSFSSKDIGEIQGKNMMARKIDMKKMHVLLVEDNVVNQRVVQRQLYKAGHVVYLANHGLEALEVLQQTDAWYESKTGKQLDIILMDWEMPIMDGLTCTREIRRLQLEGKVLRHIEILATTANARPEQINTALESGIDSVMVKPFLVKNLLEHMCERLTTSSNRKYNTQNSKG
ncbi:Aerobic respiration control sensor protein ArcB [Golovinomyces cichoracearum]|uniref:histidine kinase n=1 Tax=Golovinomyces cichoracearum TaxID=62708 RepID=A0A420IJ60_9PEZI|nr:Aerobic respiration control sensor protein ArcB [Golovinomyces cichoracearum]